jgi:hypothetical protein
MGTEEAGQSAEKVFGVEVKTPSVEYIDVPCTSPEKLLLAIHYMLADFVNQNHVRC